MQFADENVNHEEVLPILEFALFQFRDGHPTLIAKEDDLVRFLADAQTRSLTTPTDR
jgi:hypothetical protein